MTYFLTKRIRKHRVPVAITALVLLLLVGFAAYSSARIRTERDAAIAARAAETTARGLAEQNRAAAELRLADALVAQGNALLAAGRYSEVESRFREAQAILADSRASPLPLQAAYLQFQNNAPPPLVTIAAHPGAIVGCAFLPGPSDRAVTAGADGTIRFWDLPTATQTGSFVAHAGGTIAVAISTDRTTALTIGCDTPHDAAHPSATRRAKLAYSARLWSLADGKLLQTLVDPARANIPPTAVAIGPRKREALVAHEDGTVNYWDLRTPSLIGPLPPPDRDVSRDPDIETETRVSAVAFTPDGQSALYATCGQFTFRGVTHVRLDRHAGSTRIRTFATRHDRIFSMAISPDGVSVLIGTAERRGYLYDLANGELTREMPALNGNAYHVDFSRNGKFAFTSGGDHVVLVVPTSNPSARPRALLSPVGWALALATTPDASLVLSGSSDGTLRLYPLKTREVREFHGTPSSTFSIAISPDGRLVASSGHSANAPVWDIATGKMLVRLKPDINANWCIQFLGDGERLLVGRQLRVFDLHSAAVLREYPVRVPGPYGAPAVSADSQTAYVHNSGNGLAIVSLETGQVRRVSTDIRERVQQVSLSPDGRVLVVAADDAAYLVDPSNGRVLHSLTGLEGRTAKAIFALDGRQVFTAGADHRIGIFDTTTGGRVGTLIGHSAPVTSLANSAAAPNLLLSGSYDGSARLWDIASRRQIASLDASGLCWTVALTPDATCVFTAGTHGPMLRWDLNRPSAHHLAASEVPAALAVLQQKPNDVAALLTMANYYHFRQQHAWVVAFYDRARAAGADVPTISLARSLWLTNDLTRAETEFRRAKDRREAPDSYIDLCINALRGPVTTTMSVPATSNSP